LNEDSLIQVFNFCGTITNLRLCGDTSKPTRFAFIEFLTRESAAMALSFTGIMLGNSPLKYLPHLWTFLMSFFRDILLIDLLAVWPLAECYRPSRLSKDHALSRPLL